ncbi:MAG: DNA topoisomerase (ATP-hydrolyzing) subunit B [Saprospiraceae bacterium]|nr:DNA topoisomerase (ATP-hydrolyzing) subunit B [Saprospiraceae bacterium]
MTQNRGEYTAKNIQALEGLEAVRRRPGMYIGSTDTKGLHHLVWEVIDNSIDEHLAGYCTHIVTTIHPDNSITVSDNGRGIPTGYHEQQKKSALEVVLTVLHAGGKFDKDTYKVSGGLHGVGVSCVNALSEHLKAEIKRDGKIWVQEYSKGKPLSDVNIVGNSEETGTTITFRPDHTIFEMLEYKRETLSNRLHELSFLNPGLKMELFDERELDDDGQPIREDFFSTGGLAEFVTYLDEGRTPLIEHPIVVKGKEDNIEVDVAMQYNDGYNENIYSFVNNINTREGGTHLRGFRMAISKVFSDYGESSGYFAKLKFKVAGEDFREGLTAVISVKIPEPQFKGQTKGELGNNEVTTVVSHAVGDILKHYLEVNPGDAKRIMEKVMLAARAREAARAARELIIGKKGLSSISLPDKFADCSSRRPEECEVYLVEGESAGGTAKTGRDRNFQAVLPLKGKILNVEKAFEHKIYESEEIKNIFNVLGVRIEEKDGERRLNIDKLRFHKVIIMCDADIDGSHIVTLILTFFFRYMRSMIEKGFIYIAAPPLYLISRGKQQQYCWTEEDRKKAVETLAKGGNEANVKIQRYKGLGEMNADQLWSTTMDPKERILKKVSIDDAAAADRTFSMLMGSEVEPRRQFIEANAKYAKVDI